MPPKGMEGDEKKLPRGVNTWPKSWGLSRCLPHGWGDGESETGGKPRLRNRMCSVQRSQSHLE